ncbi:autophagy protein atg9 [Modicella reniformis]|uniref:Autophagy-related protein 9 n=1 Tax=Modicella reniformis TaxID=1440133 RepID=A0A9P6M315_9FUNG|nr:autophagy protein atg9 [Modicella reniformis]
MFRHQYKTLSNAEEDSMDGDDSIDPTTAGGASSFLRRSNSALQDTPLGQDTPLMPLFTPVLQDFQSRFGSTILQPQHFNPGGHELYASSDDSPPNFHERLQDDYDDDDDDDDNDDNDNDNDDDDDDEEQQVNNTDVSARKNPLFAPFDGPSNAPFATNHGLGKRPFLETRRDLSPTPAPNSTSRHTRNGRSGESRRKLNTDHNTTDHEASASLMIEMNHQQHGEDEGTAGHWSFGERARQWFWYKRPGMNPAELAMWKWLNVENLDNFLTKVYDYYVGKGMYTILLERCLNLLTFAFVIGFATFLVGCVDYPKLWERHSKQLEHVLIPQCMHKLSAGTFMLLLLFATFWVGQLIRLAYDIPELMDMCNFYTCLLNIPDEDIQTVSWAQVVNKIIQIRDNNPNTTTAATIHTTDTQRLNAHDIANRIMRKENYMIAMFNKELISLSPPVPFLRNRTILTRILEWSLGFCILGFVFDERGQVRKRFLKDTRRAVLVDGLKRRFQFMGFATMLFSPLISVYLMLYFFFRYFEVREIPSTQEYHKNPGSIGTRQYTPLAKWKFKEFNELPHLFETRIDASYPLAMKYNNQFPKEKTILVCRFVAFISGSFAAVLALMTLFDQELLLGLEITSEKTVFFYLGLFGTIMAASRGMIPDQAEIFDPEVLLREVVEYTHYMPDEWRDKLHTDEVRKQFSMLFEYKAVLFLLEFMSLILTPLILCFGLPSCSEKIVNFFRECTVHVDGVGYVCSFAVFDFKRHGNVKYGAPADTTTDERFISNEGKMEKSFLNFKQNNPDWEPNNPEGSMYLSKLMEVDAEAAHGRHHHHHHHRHHSGESPSPRTQSQMRQRSSHAKSHNNSDKGLYHGPSRLSAVTSTRYDETSDVDDEVGRDGQGAGVKFYLPSKQQSFGQDQTQGTGGYVSREYDETHSQDRQGRRSPGQGFRSDLGDSFVSEIGQSSSRHESGSGKGKGGRGEKDKGNRDKEDMSDAEDEREVQKQGVFGLLNQIYEMNTATM